MPQPFKTFSDTALFQLWFRSLTYAQIVHQIRLLGFEANPDQVRRRIRTILKRKGELPLGRAATTQDYKRIKAKYLADWQEEDIL